MKKALYLAITLSESHSKNNKKTGKRKMRWFFFQFKKLSRHILIKAYSYVYDDSIQSMICAGLHTSALPSFQTGWRGFFDNDGRAHEARSSLQYFYFFSFFTAFSMNGEAFASFYSLCSLFSFLFSFLTSHLAGCHAIPI